MVGRRSAGQLGPLQGAFKDKVSRKPSQVPPSSQASKPEARAPPQDPPRPECSGGWASEAGSPGGGAGARGGAGPGSSAPDWSTPPEGGGPLALKGPDFPEAANPEEPRPS